MRSPKPPGTVILAVEVGSTLYGVQGSDGVDDLDLMSVVVERSEYVTGLRRWESHVCRTAAEGERSQTGDIDHTYHSLRKFLSLACKGNPSILCALFAPERKLHVSSPLGLGLQRLYPSIVSKQAIPRYRGYMRSQALRLLGERGVGRGARTGARPELVEKYGYDTKFAMHMVRLGCQGRELSETGRLVLPMKGIDKGVCKRVRSGQFSVDEALNYAFHLDAELAAFETGEKASVLPDEPDYEVVNAWLHEAYMQTWGVHFRSDDA